MAHIYAVSKRSISERKIYTGWEWRDGKNIPCKCNPPKKKSGVVILITDKLDFKSPESTQQFHFSVFI